MPNLIELSCKTISIKKLNRLTKIAETHIKQNQHPKPMVAIIVKGSRIVGIGTNKTKTHTKQAEHSRYKDICKSIKLHAEIDAILATPEALLQGSDIYVIRIRRMDGSLGSSTPCPACMGACIKAGLRRIYFVED